MNQEAVVAGIHADLNGPYLPTPFDFDVVGPFLHGPFVVGWYDVAGMAGEAVTISSQVYTMCAESVLRKTDFLAHEWRNYYSDDDHYGVLLDGFEHRSPEGSLLMKGFRVARIQTDDGSSLTAIVDDPAAVYEIHTVVFLCCSFLQAGGILSPHPLWLTPRGPGYIGAAAITPLNIAYTAMAPDETAVSRENGIWSQWASAHLDMMPGHVNLVNQPVHTGLFILFCADAKDDMDEIFLPIHVVRLVEGGQQSAPSHHHPAFDDVMVLDPVTTERITLRSAFYRRHTVLTYWDVLRAYAAEKARVKPVEISEEYMLSDYSIVRAPEIYDAMSLLGLVPPRENFAVVDTDDDDQETMIYEAASLALVPVHEVVVEEMFALEREEGGEEEIELTNEEAAALVETLRKMKTQGYTLDQVMAGEPFEAPGDDPELVYIGRNHGQRCLMRGKYVFYDGYEVSDLFDAMDAGHKDAYTMATVAARAGLYPSEPTPPSKKEADLQRQQYVYGLTRAELSKELSYDVTASTSEDARHRLLLRLEMRGEVPGHQSLQTYYHLICSVGRGGADHPVSFLEALSRKKKDEIMQQMSTIMTLEGQAIQIPLFRAKVEVHASLAELLENEQADYGESIDAWLESDHFYAANPVGVPEGDKETEAMIKDLKVELATSTISALTLHATLNIADAQATWDEAKDPIQRAREDERWSGVVSSIEGQISALSLTSDEMSAFLSKDHSAELFDKVEDGDFETLQSIKLGLFSFYALNQRQFMIEHNQRRAQMWLERLEKRVELMEKTGENSEFLARAKATALEKELNAIEAAIARDNRAKKTRSERRKAFGNLGRASSSSDEEVEPEDNTSRKRARNLDVDVDDLSVAVEGMNLAGPSKTTSS